MSILFSLFTSFKIKQLQKNVERNGFNPGLPPAIVDKPQPATQKKKGYERRKGGGPSGSVSCRWGGGWGKGVEPISKGSGHCTGCAIGGRGTSPVSIDTCIKLFFKQ